VSGIPGAPFGPACANDDHVTLCNLPVVDARGWRLPGIEAFCRPGMFRDGVVETARHRASGARLPLRIAIRLVLANGLVRGTDQPAAGRRFTSFLVSPINSPIVIPVTVSTFRCSSPSRASSILGHRGAMEVGQIIASGGCHIHQAGPWYC